MKIKTKVRSGAGGIWENHSARKLVVKSKVRAGTPPGDGLNHNARKLK